MRKDAPLALPSIKEARKKETTDPLKAISEAKAKIAEGKVPMEELEETMGKVLNISLDGKDKRGDSKDEPVSVTGIDPDRDHDADPASSHNF